MTLHYDQAIALAALVTRDLRGQNTTIGENVVYLGVYPVEATGGARAAGVVIHASGDVAFAINAVPNTEGLESARLRGGVEYVFPLHPDVKTLGFLSAVGSTCDLNVRWVIP